MTSGEEFGNIKVTEVQLQLSLPRWRGITELVEKVGKSNTGMAL
jgi:hypothetical protein